jgi:hypothetical protein
VHKKIFILKNGFVAFYCSPFSARGEFFYALKSVGLNSVILHFKRKVRVKGEILCQKAGWQLSV